MSDFDTAFAAHRSGRLDEAEHAYRDLLKRNTGHADAHHLLGLIVWQRGDIAEAEHLLRTAIALDENAVYLTNFANLLCESNRVREADAMLRRACELAPSYAPAHYNLGILLIEAQRFDEAESALHDALACDPELREGWTCLGGLLAARGRHAEAVDAFRHALAFDPTRAAAHRDLGLALIHTRNFAEAETAIQDALRLDPTSADAFANLAVVHAHTRRWEDALNAGRSALALDPSHRTARYNLAGMMSYMDRLDEAEALYREAIEREPRNANERFSLGQLLLSQGRYEEGWRLNEARLEPDHEAPRRPWAEATCPVWQGEPLDGKRLLLVHEQGFGDSIQFARYVPLLKARGAISVSIRCDAPLKPLLQTVEGIDGIVLPGEAAPACDYGLFFMSLPFRLGTRLDTIPDRLPYLHALPERVDAWRAHLPKQGLKIGLVWKGSPANSRDALRSLPSIASLRALGVVEGIEWVSLQKGSGEEEVADSPFPIVSAGSHMRDFADTAAVVSQLDLLISVDTATVHVAGALNMPCWVLLPHGNHADWRWLREPEAASPWYPGIMRLFRQRIDGDWDEVASRVAAALAQWAAARRPR